MIGITSYGAYLPKYRMERKIILQQMGWFNGGSPKGEKAVVNCDEDTITMAVASCSNSLLNNKRDEIDGLYLASLSLPFSLRQNSVVIAEALNLREDIRTADFTSSRQCGTNALIAAVEGVMAGSAKQIAVCASDARRAKPGSPQEYTWGDGAATLCVGNDNVIAEYKGEYSVSKDFIDQRIIDTEEFERGWESRWIRDEGYMKIIPKAISGLLEKTETTIDQYAKVCIACPNKSALKGLNRRLKLAPEQYVDNLALFVGDTGSAMPIMMMCSALEHSNAGDKVMLISFGYGAQAMAFEVTPQIQEAKKDSRGVDYALARKTSLKEYTRYLAYKRLMDFEMGIRGESVSATAMTELYRQGKAVSALEGVVCKACNTPQFPKHKVCSNPKCKAQGQMEKYSFADKVGKVASFTADSLAFSWDPPQFYGAVDFEGGGRIYLDFTDCNKDTIKIGTQVEMTFRRKYIDNIRGYYGYFWKATPIEE